METLILDFNPEMVYVERVDLNPIEDSIADLLYFKGRNYDDNDNQIDVIIAITKEHYFRAYEDYIENKLYYSERYGEGTGLGYYLVKCEDKWLDADDKQITLLLVDEDCVRKEYQCYFADEIICDIECG